MNRSPQVHRPRRAFFRLRREYQFLILVAPTLLYFVIFHYIPMLGTLIAFTDYSIGQPMWASPFVGLRWFEEFFHSRFFGRLVGNTITLSVLNLLFSFPVPLIFALLLNEVHGTAIKRTVQTISYLPHFISLVVVVGILNNLFSPSDGIVNHALMALHWIEKPIHFFGDPKYFRALYIGSGIWQEFGWNSIIYAAALTAINPMLYEAARIDGAHRGQLLWHITLPSLTPTMVTLLILAVGNLMNVGFEKILLMYNPTTYSVADVLSTYVYRKGIDSMQYSFAAAVGLFNSAINLALLLAVNAVSRKYTGASLW